MTDALMDCATHQPSAPAHRNTQWLQDIRAHALRLDQLAQVTSTPTEANFHRTTAELLRDMALKLETQND